MGRLLKTEQGKAGTVVVVVLLFAAMGAAVVYLMSDINGRLYRVRPVDATLVIEKGRKLPWGFAPYVPSTPELAAAYAPIPLPAGETLPAIEVFEDRSDIDRTLFGLMAGWAKARFGAKDAAQLEQARLYMERLRILPGLSEEQRRELARLTADMALGEGRRLLIDLEARLVDAAAQFTRARELGATDPIEVERLSREVARLLATLRNPPVDVPAEAPLTGNTAASAPPIQKTSLSAPGPQPVSTPVAPLDVTQPKPPVKP